MINYVDFYRLDASQTDVEFHTDEIKETAERCKKSREESLAENYHEIVWHTADPLSEMLKDSKVMLTPPSSETGDTVYKKTRL